LHYLPISIPITEEIVTDYADQQVNIATQSECEYRKAAIHKFTSTNRTTEFCTDVCLNTEVLVKKSGSEYLYLTGMIIECGDEEIEPGIFTNLAKYLDWIEEVVWK
jgi:secreted trypsin-like serine protease